MVEANEHGAMPKTCHFTGRTVSVMPEEEITGTKTTCFT